VPLVIEVKSHFDGDRKLVARMAEVLGAYSGPAVGMSFDPDQVLALRELMPSRPRGIVAEREYTEDEWPEASAAQRRGMTHLRHAFRTKPHFVAYWVDELPARTLDRPQHFRPAAPDLDGADAGAARPGRTTR
jgi:hypothetical protein